MIKNKKIKIDTPTVGCIFRSAFTVHTELVVFVTPPKEAAVKLAGVKPTAHVTDSSKVK